MALVVATAASDAADPVLVCGDAAYRTQVVEGFEVCVKLPSAKLEAPYCRWQGAKIPLALWQQILQFFEASYEETKSETQVRLFYNPRESRWTAWAFPQERGLGMSAKELPDHPNKAPQRAALGRGFIPWGTVHHHCAASAFQSGTDQTDETPQNGLHITVGHVGSAKYDLDGRVYFKQTKYSADWAQWFEFPEQWAGIPETAKAAVLIEVLKAPPPETVEFPPVWMDNLIVSPRQHFFGGAGAAGEWCQHNGMHYRLHNNGGNAGRDAADQGVGPYHSQEWPPRADAAPSPGTSNLAGYGFPPDMQEGFVLRRIQALLRLYEISDERFEELYLSHAWTSVVESQSKALSAGDADAALDAAVRDTVERAWEQHTRE